MECNCLILREKRVLTVAVFGTVEMVFLLIINTLHSTAQIPYKRMDWFWRY